MAELTYVDVHGFAGGFAAGATQAGMTLIAKIEDRTAFGTSLLEANRVFLGDRWQAQAAPAADWEPVQADVVIGTPPCTAFSGMSVGSKNRGVDGTINHCMWDLIEYAAKVRPAVVLMESVAQAYTNGRDLMRRLGEKLNELTGLSYQTTHVLQNNLSTGGCTMRRRYFLVLSQVPFGVEVPQLTALPTVDDAIGDLQGLEYHTWDDQRITMPASEWVEPMRRPDGMVDGHWTDDNPFVKIVREQVVGGDNGVGWRPGDDYNNTLRRYYDRHGQLPDHWQRLYRGKREDSLGKTIEQHYVERDFETGGFSRPRKWRWDRPGYVITGAGYYGTWHPENRPYTHRELARVLGFPDTWLVGEARTDKRLFAYWGKGTSVHPARWIAEWAKASLEGNPGEVTGELLDHGDRFIDISNVWRPVARAQFGTTQFGGDRTRALEEATV